MKASGLLITSVTVLLAFAATALILFESSDADAVERGPDDAATLPWVGCSA